MSNKTFSPYACAKIVNAWLSADGIQKKLPPQMLYQYVAKGYIASVAGEKCKKVVTEEALATWYAKYTNKKTEEVNEAQEIEDAFDGEDSIVVDGVDVDDEQTLLFTV